jgi:tRNA pseudouridine13 synthase
MDKMQLPTGMIRTTEQDFQVEEIPSYLPSGAGDHLYVWIEKIDMSTDFAVKQIAKAIGCAARDIGSAGLKDRHAVTRQWLSIPMIAKDSVEELRAKIWHVEGIKVLSAERHNNKLRTGHLRGNRFRLVVRSIVWPEGTGGASAKAGLTEAAAKLARDGVPNAYGKQRFGHDGRNVADALAWLRGEARAPRDERLRRLQVSALQSEIFNRVLERRLQDGSWLLPTVGEWLERTRPMDGSGDSGRRGPAQPEGDNGPRPLEGEKRGFLFRCVAAEQDTARLVAGEVSTTGPMMGPEMPRCEGPLDALETACAAEVMGDNFDLGLLTRYGEGTRRALRMPVNSMQATWDGEDCVLEFALPSGAYATTVLAQLFRVHEPERVHRPEA